MGQCVTQSERPTYTLTSACAVDSEHPSRLAHVQNDLICSANRVQHRTADSAHIGGSVRVFQVEG
jgi:hypothetical protein